MGSQLSAAYFVVRSVIRDFKTLSSRISLSPGIPVPNPSISYWTVPNSPIYRYGADADLTQEVDILIIGSGITGTAVAKAILEGSSGKSIRLVMLEARDICSGATGRNGGHISPGFTEYSFLKTTHGLEATLEILRFRLAHIKFLLSVAAEEDLLRVSQARPVVDYDVYFDQDLLSKVKAELKTFVTEVPADIYELVEILEDRERLKALMLSPSVRACIVKQGAALHPYRFVTGILSNLLSRYSNFQLFTHTPCTEIRVNNGYYAVQTPRGEIRALHVVHATNAWASHLLPGMRKKIIPLRGHMSAQRPGRGLAPETSSRGFIFYPSQNHFALDYLTQLLPQSASDLPSCGEMMYGGGANLGGASDDMLLENFGVSDDSETQFQAVAYLAGSLQRYFGENWGAESVVDESEDDGKWEKGRLKAAWSGIIGFSSDTLPWVGRVPKIASGRNTPVEMPNAAISSALAPPGEWISAGYTGEGMVQAWLCGLAVAHMILKPEQCITQNLTSNANMVQLPAIFLISEKRVKIASFEGLMASFAAG